MAGGFECSLEMSAFLNIVYFVLCWLMINKCVTWLKGKLRYGCFYGIFDLYVLCLFYRLFLHPPSIDLA